MSSTYKKIAIAGATGTLGPFLVRALLDAGLEVTTLSRTNRTTTQDRAGVESGVLPNNVKTIQVDYDSPHSLTEALQGQDAVVSNLHDFKTQAPLIDAAIAAGVKRILPAEFGSNVSGNHKTASLPVFKDGKLAVQKYLHDRADRISYTFVVNGFFLDWGLEAGVLLGSPGSTVKVFDGGDTKHSLSTRADVAKAVVGIFQHPDETKNRAVYVQSVAISQNELIAIVSKAQPVFQPRVEHVTTASALEAAHGKLGQGGAQIGAAMFDYIIISCFGKGYGNDWSTKNDNALLGIKELSKEEVEAIAARAKI